MRLISIALILAFPLFAQQSGDYSISGVVVNAQTGEPLKYALISLTGFRKVEPSQQVDARRLKMSAPIQKTALSSETGEFQFHGLSPATYSLRAQKPGFNVLPGPNELAMKPIDLQASVSGVQMKLSPLGVIEGKIVDQNDEPLRGVNVIALQIEIKDGARDTNSVRSVATDDRGIYRLWNLASGRYYIKAAGKSGGTYRYVGDTTPYYSSWQSFAPVYFGGGRTLETATAVQIEPGSKATADLTLNIEPAFKIRGTLANIPADGLTFDLLQGTEDTAASRASLNMATSKFEVQDVTPGSYILRVTQQGKMRGEVPVTVAGADVNDVSITLAPAVTVQGITRVLGAPLTIKQMPGFERAQAAIPSNELERFDQAIPTNVTYRFKRRRAGLALNPPRTASLTGGRPMRTTGNLLLLRFSRAITVCASNASEATRQRSWLAAPTCWRTLTYWYNLASHHR